MNLDTKKKIAHLESQNTMALECIKQVNEIINGGVPYNYAEQVSAVKKALKWFKKYGSV